MKQIKEKFDRKLLVEGNDDQHVIWSLCEKFQVKENFDVVDCGGISNLLPQISVRLKQSGLQALGIIIDADTNLKDQWDKIVAILSSVGINCPNALPETGLILQKGDIKIGVWIMPNNNLNGMLEDFISFLVPVDDNLAPIVVETLNSIEGQHLNRYQVIHKSKAHIHSWLAWQEDPGTPMGLAITKKYLTTDNAMCASFIEWLNNIFT
jgi:hypothetical protein